MGQMKKKNDGTGEKMPSNVAGSCDVVVAVIVEIMCGVVLQLPHFN